MGLFKSVDEKLQEVGFVKVGEDKYGVGYERYNKKHGYTQCVNILHKASERHIIQSYDKELLDIKRIGNTAVGLTGYEMKLFLKKMKQAGLYNKLPLEH